jgi:hypothetical protein
MKKEYDFSKGERGKFYHPDARFNMPIYLDEEVERFVMKLAEAKKTTLAEIVNTLLLKDKELIDLMPR